MLCVIIGESDLNPRMHHMTQGAVLFMPGDRGAYMSATHMLSTCHDVLSAHNMII